MEALVSDIVCCIAVALDSTNMFSKSSAGTEKNLLVNLKDILMSLCLLKSIILF